MRESNLQIVLVRPQYASNIGFCARAMGNMGARQLHIIAPECKPDELSAHQSAAGSQKPLENLISYDNWDAFLEKESTGVRIALTARDGKQRKTQSLVQILEHIRQNSVLAPDTKFYLVFGPEDDGLNNEDLLRCHFAACIPTYGEFRSLNLGHACLIAQYIFQSHRDQFQEENNMQSSVASGFYPYEIIAKSLQSIGFDIDPDKNNAAKKFTDLLMRAIPNEEEAGLIHKIFYQMYRKKTGEK